MMETSIDEGIETEEPDTEEDPPHSLSPYQTARFGQRRHTLSEGTNQPGASNQGTASHTCSHIHKDPTSIDTITDLEQKCVHIIPLHGPEFYS